MLNQPKEFKIIVNQKEVLIYDFSYLKSGIYEVLGSISIKMGQLDYNLASYANNSIVVDSPGFWAIRVGLPNCLYFQKDNDVDSNEIKGALDIVKDNYLKLYKKIEDLYGK